MHGKIWMLDVGAESREMTTLLTPILRYLAATGHDQLSRWLSPASRVYYWHKQTVAVFR